MAGKNTSIGGYNMKTKRNIFSKVAALVMCAVIFAGFAPTQTQATPSRDLPLVISAEARQVNREGIRDVEYALLHHGVVVERQFTSTGGIARFSTQFRVSDIPNLELQLVNADGWVSADISADANLPVTNFENWGGGTRIFIGIFTPASIQTPEPPAQPPAPPSDVYELRMQIGSHTFFNGTTNVHLDVAPQIVGDRTMAPVRAVGEALGAVVDFNPDTRVITFTRNGEEITTTVGDQFFDTNGTYLGSSLIVEGNRTLVPVRAISYLLGAVVDWIPDTRTIIITQSI